jgi:hypothetical protein
VSSCHKDYKQPPPDNVPPNGDRAGVSKCSEGDHEGHIREVPQEEHSQLCTLLKLCAHYKEEFQLIVDLIASIAGKLTSKITVVTLLMHA